MDYNIIPRKKQSDESEPWLLSYGDMVTNLLAFFILLFSISSVNKVRFEMLAEHFNKEKKDKMPLSELTKKITEMVQEKGMGQDVKVTLTEKGVEVSFSDKVLFDSGRAALKKEAYPIIDSLIEILSTKDVLDRDIVMEGHTDSVPIISKLFPSNWELSSSRSSVIVRYLEENGIAKKRLEARGYADTRPRVEELPGKGSAENRRALMVIN